MRCDIGVRKSDSREAENTHVRVDVFEDALRKKDQTYGQSHKIRLLTFQVGASNLLMFTEPQKGFVVSGP